MWPYTVKQRWKLNKNAFMQIWTILFLSVVLNKTSNTKLNYRIIHSVIFISLFLPVLSSHRVSAVIWFQTDSQEEENVLSLQMIPSRRFSSLGNSSSPIIVLWHYTACSRLTLSTETSCMCVCACVWVYISTSPSGLSCLPLKVNYLGYWWEFHLFFHLFCFLLSSSSVFNLPNKWYWGFKFNLHSFPFVVDKVSRGRKCFYNLRKMWSETESEKKLAIILEGEREKERKRGERL